MKVKDRIQLLIEILESSKINTLEVSSFWGFRKIKLSKKEEKIITPDTKASSNSVSDNLKPKTEENLDGDGNHDKILDVGVQEQEGYVQKAPLVGTIYLSPKPDEDNFVKEGQKIKKGETVCIIEAMKIFNDIEAEKDGIVKNILVENEAPVEFGQAIIEIDVE